MKTVCDVLVVGGGGSALRAAIAAHELAPDLRVVLVTKGELGKSGVTATACSDRMAFHATLLTTEPGGPDAWRHHADDIYRIGGDVSDADLAQVLARHSAEAFDYLDKLGVPWARRPDGSVDQFVTDGSVYARACYTGPYTANHIEAALVSRVRELPIDIVEHHMVGELLLDDARARIAGAAVVSEQDSCVTAMRATSIVLAAGGAGQAYAVNVYPSDCTGDGFALAYRAGAELVNLEFIQIGLCSTETRLACSGSMMRALPRLVNDREEEILPRYFPKGTTHAAMYAVLYAKGASWPVSHREPSHVIDIAVATELANGRSVYLDYSRDPQELDRAALPESIRDWYRDAKGVDLCDQQHAGTPLARLRAINLPSVEWLAERGVNLDRGDRVAIAPATQHFQGGVKIRTRGETTIEGLYAAGEVAGGQHGANRPGGNALLDSQVFGRISGESAARNALEQSLSGATSQAAAERAISALSIRNGLDAEVVREQVGHLMSEACSVYRTEKSLRRLVDALDGLASQGVNVTSRSRARDLEAINILQAAQLVARAALARDESRGPHLRFPDDGSLTPVPRDDERWRQYNVLRASPDGLILEAREPARPN